MRRAGILVVAGLVLFSLGAGHGPRVRRPMGPNVFYPGDPEELREAVKAHCASAPKVELPGPYVGCIVPHSGYRYSGNVAGHVYAGLKPGQYDRVIVLAPSHHAKFRGCSIAAVDVYRTPLGDVPLDQEAIRRLAACSLVSVRSVVYRGDAYNIPEVRRVALHENEHSIEVQLPFLQVQLGEFKLVPIIVGEFETPKGDRDDAAYDAMVKSLQGVVDSRTLLIAACEFTHFGYKYDYRPFEDDIASRIAALDMEAFNLIQARDVVGLRQYLERTGNTFSAPGALEIMLRVLPDSAQGVLFGYDTSGRMAGTPDESVSFAALGFF